MPKFRKVTLKPGRYQVKTLDGRTVEQDFSPERIQHISDTHKEMKKAGLLIPVPFKHDASRPISKKERNDTQENAGYTGSSRILKDGSMELVYDIPDEDIAKKIGKSIREVSPLILAEHKDGTGKVWKDCMVHAALVTHPVQPGQENFIDYQPEQAGDLAVALSCYLGPIPDDEGGDNKGIDKGDGQGHGVSDVVACLAGIGVKLPEDTNEQNLIERIVVACHAIKGTEEDDPDNDDGNTPGKEQPHPIAMGGLTFGDESTMTDQDKAKVENLAKLAAKSVSDSLTGRIKALVKSRRITQQWAIDNLVPSLEGFQLSLNDDGTPTPSPLEEKLSMLESLPEPQEQEHPFLGTPKTSTKKPVRDDASMSIFHEEELDPELIGEDIASEGEELEKAVEQQLKSMYEPTGVH